MTTQTVEMRPPATFDSVTITRAVPSADAGPDQTVDEGVLVTLDGSQSTDDGDALTSYVWSQPGGSTVVLDLGDPQHPTFTAPFVGGNTTLTFRLIVGDETDFSDPDTVDIMVLEGPDPTIDADISTTLVHGPWVEDTGSLDPFDVNQDGSIDELDEGPLIGIGLDQSQHYVIRVDITNGGTTGGLDDAHFWDGLRDTFAFDPLGEDFADGVINTLCDDDTCDGVGEGLNCTATLSGPSKKKGSPDLRYVVIEPETDLAAGDTCETYLYLSTKAASTKGKGSKNTSIFEPSECSFSETDVNGQVPNLIPVNEGVDMLDSNTGELLQGPVGSIHFVPVCP